MSSRSLGVCYLAWHFTRCTYPNEVKIFIGKNLLLVQLKTIASAVNIMKLALTFLKQKQNKKLFSWVISSLSQVLSHETSWKSVYTFDRNCVKDISYAICIDRQTKCRKLKVIYLTRNLMRSRSLTFFQLTGKYLRQ